MIESFIIWICAFLGLLTFICCKCFQCINDWYALFSFLPVVLIPVFTNWNSIFISLKILWFSLRRKDIRMSMSYIIRIKVNDRYLLVRNSHNNNYQFVGGKFKYYSRTKLDEFDMKDDTKLGTSGSRNNDLALFIPAKNVKNFLKWFDSELDREIDHYREFSEELLETKKTEKPILDGELFKRVEFKKIKILDVLRMSPEESGFDCIEYNRYEILEPIFTQDQLAFLEKLQDTNDSVSYKWASSNLINHCGFDEELKTKKYGINEHTKWCMNGKYSK